MWFSVIGSRRATAEDVEIPIDAVTEAHAEFMANDRGILVERVSPLVPPQLPVGMRFVGNHLEIANLDFFGQWAISPNRRFIVSWMDAEPGAHCGGARQHGKGVYMVLDEGCATLRGRLERPNHGVVSNTGVFAINDWLFARTMSGVFYVISPAGEVLVKYDTRANLCACGISDDGRFAVCQTLSSDCETHSRKLHLFDVQTGKLLWRLTPECDLAHSLSFDVDEGVLFLHFFDRGLSFRYSLDGDFLDGAKYEQWRRDELEAHPNGYLLAVEAAEQLAAIDAVDAARADYSKVTRLLNRAIGTHMPDSAKARCYRVLGEIAEKQGKPAEAISHFNKALALDPKVGLKLRVCKLQQEQDNATGAEAS
jgi:hypothetical protein